VVIKAICDVHVNGTKDHFFPNMNSIFPYQPDMMVKTSHVGVTCLEYYRL
jgi:hypothetical protein